MVLIDDAVRSLASVVGVKEKAPSGELVDLLLDGKTDECITAIASHMGLPVQIRVSYTSQSRRFETRSLVTTDSTGRGSQGIAAQVALPSNLPLYHSPKLTGFLIDMTLSHNFRSAPRTTAITLIAHELSHVLLTSLLYPRREDEWHVASPTTPQA